MLNVWMLNLTGTALSPIIYGWVGRRAHHSFWEKPQKVQIQGNFAEATMNSWRSVNTMPVCDYVWVCMCMHTYQLLHEIVMLLPQEVCQVSLAARWPTPQITCQRHGGCHQVAVFAIAGAKPTIVKHTEASKVGEETDEWEDEIEDSEKG